MGFIVFIFSVGGNVVQIEWDPTGMRLAVLFSECNYIAVLSLTPGNHNYLLPCGLICGREGEYPVAIAFQKDYRHGALLTIVRIFQLTAFQCLNHCILIKHKI